MEGEELSLSLSSSSAFLLVSWFTSWWRAPSHPSSLSICASDAVVQAAGRAALQTLTLSAWVRRAGGLED